jgi:hypothetical protein
MLQVPALPSIHIRFFFEKQVSFSRVPFKQLKQAHSHSLQKKKEPFKSLRRLWFLRSCLTALWKVKTGPAVRPTGHISLGKFARPGPPEKAWRWGLALPFLDPQEMRAGGAGGQRRRDAGGWWSPVASPGLPTVCQTPMADQTDSQEVRGPHMLAGLG